MSAILNLSIGRHFVGFVCHVLLVMGLGDGMCVHDRVQEILVTRDKGIINPTSIVGNYINDMIPITLDKVYVSSIS